MGYKIVIDHREIEIYMANSAGNYPIYWEGLPLGYVALLSNSRGEDIWCGSTRLLDKLAHIIGGYIIRSDCSFYGE